MIIRIHKSENKFVEREVDEYVFDRNCLRLYKIIEKDAPDIVRLPQKNLVAAYWGIMGFEIFDE